MPKPSAWVFQPAKLKPVFAIVPALASVVFPAVPLATVGAGIVEDAEVCPLPLYVIVEFH